MLSNKGVKGFTLLEAVMACSFTTLLILLALSASMNISKIISAQEAVIRTDQQAQKAFAIISRELGGAILPATVNGSTTRTEFADIELPQYGFSGGSGNCQADNWRTAILAGVDNLAYVTLVDSQDVGDVFDGHGHYQVGQNRFGVSYLGASAEYRPDMGDLDSGGNPIWKLYVRNEAIDENVNVLTILNPAAINDIDFEMLESPTTADWRTFNGTASGFGAGGLWQPITAFMAIRFVPMTDGNTNNPRPVVIREADAALWPGFEPRRYSDNIPKVDLNDNGTFNDEFHLGKLQLLYSGGDLVEANPAAKTVTAASHGQIVMDLTSYSVLRNVNRTDPIFQVLPINGDISLMRVRLLLLDSQYMTDQFNTASDISGGLPRLILRPQPSSNSVDIQGRWYESQISMDLMNR